MAYFISGVLPSYFSREFSFARLRLPVESKTMKICYMIDNFLYVVDDLKNPIHYSGEIEPQEMKLASQAKLMMLKTEAKR